jgi:hypothetical protein
MKFRINKQVQEEIEVCPPYYCKDSCFHYFISESGKLVSVSTRTIIVNDLNSSIIADSIIEAVAKSVECSKVEFLRVFDEATKSVAAALDHEVTLSHLPY